MEQTILRLFTIIEYEIGGLVAAISSYVFLIHYSVQKGEFIPELNSSELLALFIFAYITGIVVDNFANFLLKSVGLEKNKAESEYNNLLRSNKSHLIDRALGFESSKRITRMAAVSLILIPLLGRILLQCGSGYKCVYLLEEVSGLYLLLGFVLCLVYWNIQVNYEKYLVKAQRIIRSR